MQMFSKLNIDNIKGFAMFKYKGMPKQCDIKKIENLYETLYKRKTSKTITIFRQGRRC